MTLTLTAASAAAVVSASHQPVVCSPHIATQTHSTMPVACAKQAWMIDLCMQHYKSLCPAVMIFNTLVNRHRHTDAIQTASA